MHQVAVVYFSHEGKTAKLATSVCDGIRQVDGVEVAAIRIVGEDIVQGRYTNIKSLELIDSCDAVIFGSPTYMGGPAAQFKAFADATSDNWETQKWSGKLAAGFTCGSSPNGDQLATLQYFSILAAQHGMFWASLDIAGDDAQGRNRLGTQLGVSALTLAQDIDPTDSATAEYLGVRVAKATLQFKSTSI